MKKPLLIIFLVLLIDQALKIYIKTTMYLGQEYHILGDWFIIHFTENKGMAYGMELGGEYGKIALSLLRIVAVGGICWYLWDITRKKMHNGLIISIALILAGAVGNIIDSAFYGLIFSESSYDVAQLFPPDGGYAGFLHGSVVDMFYFPIIEGHFPEWFPFVGTEEFIFFRPVFNVADAAISVGVAMIILFQKKYFPKQNKSVADEQNSNATDTLT